VAAEHVTALIHRYNPPELVGNKLQPASIRGIEKRGRLRPGELSRFTKPSAKPPEKVPNGVLLFRLSHAIGCTPTELGKAFAADAGVSWDGYAPTLRPADAELLKAFQQLSVRDQGTVQALIEHLRQMAEANRRNAENERST
jgi:hypothetical protein